MQSKVPTAEIGFILNGINVVHVCIFLFLKLGLKGKKNSSQILDCTICLFNLDALIATWVLPYLNLVLNLSFL